jgi:hypothetical protein
MAARCGAGTALRIKGGKDAKKIDVIHCVERGYGHRSMGANLDAAKLIRSGSGDPSSRFCKAVRVLR